MEAALRIQQEIAEKKPARAFGVFKSGMKNAGFTLTAPDAASLYSKSGAIIREREKLARQAPPPPAAGAAASSNAAGIEPAMQDEALEWDEREDPPPLIEEVDSDEEGPADEHNWPGESGLEENGEEEPQLMPFSDAKECFFFPHQGQ